MCDIRFITTLVNKKYFLKEEVINLNKIWQENEPIITGTSYTYTRFYDIIYSPTAGTTPLSMKISNAIIPTVTVYATIFW